MTHSKPPDHINTTRGVIKFPAYFPVTTFGEYGCNDCCATR